MEAAKNIFRVRRRFFTDGEMTPSMAREFFLVNRSKHDIDEIAIKLKTISPFLLIHSHRQGGKSTKMHTLASKFVKAGLSVIWYYFSIKFVRIEVLCSSLHAGSRPRGES